MVEAAPRRKGLLVVPEFPWDSFWSYRHIIPLIGRKAAFPPLGLLTFAGYMPDHWDLRIVDLNTTAVPDRTLRRMIAEADAAFVSAMSIQKRSIVEILSGPASGLDTPFVLGGPFASSYRDQILDPQTESDRILHDGLDILVWGEAEGSMGALLEYLESGPHHAPGRPRILMPTTVARAEPGSRGYLNDRSVFRALDDVPLPRWDLVRVRDYQTLMIQTTAGCPFRCDFCDIVQFNGGFNRPKAPAMVRHELERILATGFRGPVFSVDDNFIGKPDAISVILDEMIEFQREHDYPFSFITQASVDLGKDRNEHLIEKMRQAGFESVFLGIENPDEEALRRMNKKQNIKVDIPATVSKIQAAGIEVLAGFIFGGDEDTPETADRIVDFIQQNNIHTAMVGMLTPVPQTPLYERLRSEGRLRLAEYTGNNTDDEVQFEPARMNRDEMKQGIHDILRRLFGPGASYPRMLGMIEAVRPNPFFARRMRIGYLRAALASLWRQGVRRLDPRYFEFLFQAIDLDRRLYRQTRSELRALSGLVARLRGAQPTMPTMDSSGTFEALIDLARDYRVRCDSGHRLEQVRTWSEGVRERFAAGSLTADDIRSVKEAAARSLRRRMRSHRFPGIAVRRALEAAIRSLHYETVTNGVIDGGKLTAVTGSHAMATAESQA
jgi:radical SAM superfamily enzyme YgiQ (UPF0313 family)